MYLLYIVYYEDLRSHLISHTIFLGMCMLRPFQHPVIKVSFNDRLFAESQDEELTWHDTPTLLDNSLSDPMPLVRYYPYLYGFPVRSGVAVPSPNAMCSCCRVPSPYPFTREPPSAPDVPARNIHHPT